METYFAKPERAEKSSVDADHHYFADNNLLDQALNSVPDVFMILNQQRQIVYANTALCKLLGLKDEIDLCGLRPGEALHCNHADVMKAGCGTSEFCRECGAVNAILASQQGKEEIRECRITQQGTNLGLDLSVWAIPLHIKEKLYTVLAIKDISEAKRKEVLERVFFHDILNTAGGIKGITTVLADSGSERVDAMISSVKESAQMLIDEINDQKQLLSAEEGDLDLVLQETTSFTILHDVITLYKKHSVSRDLHLKLAEDSVDMFLVTDIALLRRVIGNMTKNALEACQPDDVVTLGSSYDETSGGLQFHVHNPGFIPRNIQLQIFQRSFSTKGKGRGLGTYSLKLLGETYLKGKVSFESSEDAGTTFRIQLPITRHDHSASSKHAVTNETASHSLQDSDLDTVTFDSAGITKRDTLLGTLDTELVPLFNQIQETMAMSSIEAFCQQITQLGQEHTFPFLTQFGRQLNTFIQAFDVEQIQNHLGLFPEIVSKLKQNQPGAPS